jgi:GNAT superfamily N-acetyltransferase
VTVSIRTVLPHEHHVLGALTVESYRALPGWADHPDPAIVEDNLGYEADLADVSARVAAGCEVYVAVNDGALVGGVTFVPTRDNPYNETPKAGPVAIRHLAIAPHAQRQGVGRALVQHCVERAGVLGADTIGMHSLSIMTGAMVLYESMGFVRAPEHDEWWGGNQGIAFVKLLA